MDNPITRPQQNAIHKYFELVAEALNEAGHEMKAVLACNKKVKELIWIYGKTMQTMRGDF